MKRRIILPVGALFVIFAVIAFLYANSASVTLKRFGARLETADIVQLVRLQGGDSSYDSGLFFTGSDSENFPTFGSIVLPKSEVQSLIQFIDSFEKSKDGSTLAHTPQYGIRALRDGKVVAEFAISWNCSNISIASQIFGFSVVDFDPRESQKQLGEMFEVFNEMLPYNPNFLQEEEEAKRALLQSLEGR